jgi:hypothetical protein
MPNNDPSPFPFPFPTHFTLASFIASDSKYASQREHLWNILDWTAPAASSSNKNSSWNAKVALASRSFYRLGTSSSLPNATAALSLCGKRIKKPSSQRESQQYLLHKLRLFVRDSFKDKALGTIKSLTKETLKANASCARRIFLECLVMASQLKNDSPSSREMEQVAVALLERGSFGLFDVPIAGENAVFPSFFLVAVALGRQAVVQKFLSWKKRSILTQCSWQGIPVLFWGCFCRRPESACELVKLLLECNADATLPCMLGDLERLATRKAPKKRAGASGQDAYSGRPLYSFEVSASLHDLPTVQLLINRIQRCNLLANAHFCFLLQADTPTSIWLLKAGASPAHQRTRSGRTPLHVAVQAGNFELVAIYLRISGGSLLLEARDCEGNTALHIAALQKEPNLYTYLTGKGANPLAKNCEGQSAQEIYADRERHCERTSSISATASNESTLPSTIAGSSVESQLAELEASAYELYDNSGTQLPKERGKFSFNERLYRSIIGSFSSASKTCPSSDAASAFRVDEFSSEEPRNSRRCSSKFSLINSLTSMFRSSK